VCGLGFPIDDSRNLIVTENKGRDCAIIGLCAREDLFFGIEGRILELKFFQILTHVYRHRYDIAMEILYQFLDGNVIF
jgi:hypothetical protein